MFIRRWVHNCRQMCWSWSNIFQHFPVPPEKVTYYLNIQTKPPQNASHYNQDNSEWCTVVKKCISPTPPLLLWGITTHLRRKGKLIDDIILYCMLINRLWNQLWFHRHHWRRSLTKLWVPSRIEELLSQPREFIYSPHRVQGMDSCISLGSQCHLTITMQDD